MTTKEAFVIVCKNKCFSLEQSVWCFVHHGVLPLPSLQQYTFVNTRGCCFNPNIGLARLAFVLSVILCCMY